MKFRKFSSAVPRGKTKPHFPQRFAQNLHLGLWGFKCTVILVFSNCLVLNTELLTWVGAGSGLTDLLSYPVVTLSQCKVVRSKEQSIFSPNPIRGLTDRGRAGLHDPEYTRCFNKISWKKKWIESEIYSFSTTKKYSWIPGSLRFFGKLKNSFGQTFRWKSKQIQIPPLCLFWKSWTVMWPHISPLIHSYKEPRICTQRSVNSFPPAFHCTKHNV